MTAILTRAGPAAGDKVLTVRQPWAYLILTGEKKIEHRSWYTKHRGSLFIHAAKARLPSFYGRIDPTLRDLPVSAIVGVVTLYDCVEPADLPDDLAEPDDLADDELASVSWCWLLRDPQPLRVPIPAGGKLGLWKWTG